MMEQLKNMQDKLWKTLTPEQQDSFRNRYSEYYTTDDDSPYKARASMLEEIFGFHNLKFSIKTWRDVMKLPMKYDTNFLYKFETFLAGFDVDLQLREKLVATFIIFNLIRMGYGGNVSEEENRDQSKIKYTIIPKFGGGFRIMELTWSVDLTCTFHTREQATNFLTYEDNIRTLCHYFNMTYSPEVG